MKSIKSKIEEVISNISSNSQSGQVLNKYKKFEAAWNSFEGRILSDGCDEIVIRHLSLDSKF